MPIKADLWQNRRFHKSIPHASNYPVISNVASTPDGLVTWTTDVPATSQVLYGFVPYLGFASSWDSALVASHSVQLTNLVPGAIYYFKVLSFRFDALSISDLYSFRAIAAGTYPAFILVSPDATRWAVDVTINGNLDTNPLPTGPAGAYEPASIVLRDSNSVYWTVTIDNTGHLITTSGGNPIGALDSISIYDANVFTWLLTVSLNGNLTTT